MVGPLRLTFPAACYDLRGRVRQAEKRIHVEPVDAAGEFSIALARTDYDVADHVTAITYPDGEVVTYEYDAAGQVRRVAGSAEYLSDLNYDVFGRPEQISHGNNVADARSYGGAAENFRLTQILSAAGANTLQNLNYDQYQHNGLLKHLSDTGPKGANNAMDNTATFTYDGLGRLRGVEGQQGLPPTSPGLRSQGWLAWLTRLGAFSRYSRSCKRWRTQ